MRKMRGAMLERLFGVLFDGVAYGSLLTIVMMVATNREEELKLHLRAAANNGVTRDEIKEALLQSAIYCGVPAANGAFRLAQEVFDALDAQSSGSGTQGEAGRDAGRDV